jgi:hypothetical protein
MTATQTLERVERMLNPHGELHRACYGCHPDGRVAFCGTSLKGIRHPEGTKGTCVVCEEFQARCPECGQL